MGGGSEEKKLKSLANELGISQATIFTGRIDYEKIPQYHNKIDIFANLSDYESFGVSVLESSACGKPIVATDTGGLREVVIKNKTGILVPVKDVLATAVAIEKLILNKSLRDEMGTAGRNYVVSKYQWEDCLNKMITIYNKY